MEVSKNWLEKYIVESNAIEGIVVRKNHHLFVDHLAAAELVVKYGQEYKVVVAPEIIHNILLKRELSDAGKFRKVPVWVGSASKPWPEHIEKLMECWKESLLKDLWSPRISTGAKLALHYHNWFEAIHPFIDGNGRTGRLVLNGIRLVFGLPWLIIYRDDRLDYYQAIRDWEKKHSGLLE